MKLTVTLQEPDYAGLTLWALPLLRQKLALPDNALGMLAGELLALPRELLGQVLEAIPYARQQQILQLLVAENQAAICPWAEALAEGRGIRLRLENLVLRDGSLRIFVEDVDYAALAAVAMPFLDREASGVRKLPGLLLHKTLEGMSPKTRQELGIRLINSNAPRIVARLNALALERGVPLALGQISACTTPRSAT